MGYHEQITGLMQKSTLKRQAKEYFLGLKRVKEITGYKSGRLDTSRLAVVLGGKVDVFKRKEDTRLVNSAVSILVDSSGSMSGKCYSLACASALTLAETLYSVGVQVEVAGFTDWSNAELVHEIYCSFGQRVNQAKMLEGMVKMGRHLCENSDAENVLIAYDRLIQTRVDKRVLIVLSDGGPSSCLHGVSDHQALQETCAFIEKDGKRTSTALWGIGIGDSDAVAQYYNNYILVDDDANMGNCLLELIKQSVTIKR